MYYIGKITADPNSLYHHGIKGQKWGKRRFQNEDGSLTEAGRQRYRMSEVGQKAKNELHDAWSRMEGRTGEHAKIDYSKGFALSREQEDSKGKFNLKHPDGWKVFEQIDAEAIKNANLDEKSKAFVDASTKYNRTLGLFGSTRKRSEAWDDYIDANERFLDEVMTKSVEYINKLPKRERDIYRDYVYRRLGLDW